MLVNFQRIAKFLRTVVVLLFAATIFGCATAPPRNVENICSIFREYPKWFWTTQAVQKRWRIPISVQMEIIYQESRFRAGAKPPRRRLLWIIPWFRPTSAYGYSQATNETWRSYKRATGHNGASRDAFTDAAKFIGWYAAEANRRLGISRRDPYKLYLAYHEGMGGYSRGTYWRKKWLIKVAQKVKRRAWVYHAQLRRCYNSLPKKPWWHFWSF